MRKFIFILLAIPSVLMSQSKYRVDENKLKLLKVTDNYTYSMIMNVHNILNKNDSLIQAFKNGESTIQKTIGHIVRRKEISSPVFYLKYLSENKSICLDCFENEFKLQLNEYKICIAKEDSIDKVTKIIEGLRKDSLMIRNDFFVVTDTVSIKNTMSTLLKTTNRNYKEIGRNIRNDIFEYRFASGINDDEKRLTIEFHNETIGENVDLEIKGTKYFYLGNISGKFLDIFSIWSNYFDKSISKNELLEKRVDKPGVYKKTEWNVNLKAGIFIFTYTLSNKYDGNWEIYGYVERVIK